MNKTTKIPKCTKILKCGIQSYQNCPEMRKSISICAKYTNMRETNEHVQSTLKHTKPLKNVTCQNIPKGAKM